MGSARDEDELGEIDRILGELRQAFIDQRSRDGPPAESTARQQLADLAQGYRHDASRERWTMYVLYFVSLVVAAGATLITWVGLDRAQTPRQFRANEFTAHALVGLVLVGIAVLVLWQAQNHRRQCRESIRLERQLVGLDSYVATLAPSIRDVVRATMAKQLFPLTLEDNDPWREARWPSADDLLRATDGSQD